MCPVPRGTRARLPKTAPKRRRSLRSDDTKEAKKNGKAAPPERYIVAAPPNNCRGRKKERIKERAGGNLTERIKPGAERTVFFFRAQSKAKLHRPCARLLSCNLSGTARATVELLVYLHPFIYSHFSSPLVLAQARGSVGCVVHNLQPASLTRAADMVLRPVLATRNRAVEADWIAVFRNLSANHAAEVCGPKRSRISVHTFPSLVN